MKEALVLYHGNCWDGFCAAWVARRALGAVEAIPVQYGQPPPDVTDRIVYILDFSYPADALQQMADVALHLTVLDHHKTAEAALKDFYHPNAIVKFDMDKSGGRLAWDHFMDEEPDWLVDYTEDRDLWRWQLPDSRAINANLRTYPLDFEVWDGLELDSKFVEAGEAVLRYMEQEVQQHVQKAKLATFDDYIVPVVNASTLMSEVGEKLAVGQPFSASYFWLGSDRCWSLRSAPDGLDVSTIAKKYGGGGHKHAAGFKETINPLRG